MYLKNCSLWRLIYALLSCSWLFDLVLAASSFLRIKLISKLTMNGFFNRLNLLQSWLENNFLQLLSCDLEKLFKNCPKKQELYHHFQYLVSLFAYYRILNWMEIVLLTDIAFSWTYKTCWTCKAENNSNNLPQIDAIREVNDFCYFSASTWRVVLSFFDIWRTKRKRSWEDISEICYCTGECLPGVDRFALTF